jgi:hypothetical protein
MKKLFALALSLTSLYALSAQDAQNAPDSIWISHGTAGINLTQVGLTNWAAGGDNSIAFDANFHYGLDHKKGKHLWQNRLELGYGLNDTKTNGTRKTNDKIYFSSNYGYQLAPKWYASFMMTFQTQFDKGYNYSVSSHRAISRFMAPGYLTLGPGATWTPNDWFKLTVSPATWRATFVLDDRLSNLGAFGVKPGRKILNQFGGNVTAEVKKNIMENVTLYSRLSLFSDYLGKPQNVVVNWDTQLNMKVNKWLSANFMLNMIYDDKVIIHDKNGHYGPRVQLKETLGVGLQMGF